MNIKFFAFRSYSLIKKKWNLDEPDGYRYYCRDLIKKPKYYTKRNFWGIVSSSGCLELQSSSEPIYNTECITVPSCSLLPFLRENNKKKMFSNRKCQNS